MWLLVIGRITGFWRGLAPRTQAFVMGLVAGMIALSLLCGFWPHKSQAPQIAAENAAAALDSTRAYYAKHDTIYARLLAQKDVQLAGALRDVASQRSDKPRAVVTVTARGRGVDTTATHVSGDVVSPSRPIPGTRTDSLVLAGPPVEGVVSATVTDSTWYWRAKLMPSPVDITLALTCSKTGPEVLASGPPWISASIGSGQVDPKVCHPTPSRWANGFRAGVVFTGTAYVVFRVVKSLLSKR